MVNALPGRHRRGRHRRGHRLVHGAAPPELRRAHPGRGVVPRGGRRHLAGHQRHGRLLRREHRWPPWSSPWCPGPASGRARSEESAVIGTVQAFALACGVLFVSLYGGFLDSLTGLLFGTFLGISDGQVATLAAGGRGRPGRAGGHRPAPVLRHRRRRRGRGPGGAGAGAVGGVPPPARGAPPPRSARSPGPCWSSPCWSCRPPPPSSSPPARRSSLALTVALAVVVTWAVAGRWPSTRCTRWASTSRPSASPPTSWPPAGGPWPPGSAPGPGAGRRPTAHGPAPARRWAVTGRPP